MPRILVTGGARVIGCHLVDSLRKEGHAVRVLDDLLTGCRENPPHGLEFGCGEIPDRAAVEKGLDGVQALLSFGHDNSGFVA
jgi:UDP-glucose 4-epimerase